MKKSFSIFLKLSLLSILIATPLLKAITPADMKVDASMFPRTEDGKIFMPGLGEMSEEEFQKTISEANAFVENLSPEDLKEFSKLTEEVASDMMDNPDAWLPAEGLLPPSAMSPKKAPPKIEPKLEKTSATKAPKPEPKKKTIVENAEVSEIIEMIKELNEKIGAVRQKVANDLITTLDKHEKSLSDLVAYLIIVQQKKHAQHFLDKEFSDLYKNLDLLKEVLEKYEPLVVIPDFLGIKKQDKKKKKKSQNALLIVSGSLDSAFTKQGINTELEKLIKKYEPEALKLKKEMEEAEKKSAKQKEKPDKLVRSRPLIHSPYRKQGYYPSAKSSQYGRPYSQGYTPSSYYDDSRYYSAPPKKHEPMKPIENKKDAGKSEELTKKEQADLAEKAHEQKKEIARQHNKIEDTLEEVERFLSSQKNKKTINSFEGYITSDSSPVEKKYSSLFEDLGEKALKLRKRIRDFRETIEPLSKSEQKKHIEDFDLKHKDGINSIFGPYKHVKFYKKELSRIPENKNDNHGESILDLYGREIERLEKERNKLYDIK